MTMSSSPSTTSTTDSNNNSHRTRLQLSLHQRQTSSSTSSHLSNNVSSNPTKSLAAIAKHKVSDLKLVERRLSAARDYAKRVGDDRRLASYSRQVDAVRDERRQWKAIIVKSNSTNITNTTTVQQCSSSTTTRSNSNRQQQQQNQMMMFIPSTATRASVTVTVTVCVLMPLVNTLSLSLGVVNNNNDSDDNDSNNDSVAVNRNTNRNSSAVDKVSHVAVLALCVVIVCWSVLVEWIMATSIEQTTSAENEPVNDVGDGEDTEVDDDDDVDIENSGNKVINLNNNIMPRPWTQVIADDVLLVKEKRGSNNTHDNKKGIAKDNRNNKTSNSNSNLDLIYPHFNNMARSAPAKLSAAFKVHNQID